MPEELEVVYPDQPMISDKPHLRYLLKEERDANLVSYIEQFFNEESFYYQLNLMMKFPFFANKILDNFEKSNEEKQLIYLNNLVYRDTGAGKIVLIDGAKGGGKTGIGTWTLDEFKEMRKDLQYYFVTKAVQRPKLPSWIIVLSDINDVPNNAVALIDEGAIQLSSRRHGTRENIDASDRLVALRHKGITMIILVQNIKMVDINVRRLADIRVGKFGIKFGAEPDTSDDVKLIRGRLRPKGLEWAYIEIPALSIFISFFHGLPAWWDEELTSKSLKGEIIMRTKSKKKTRSYAKVPY